MIKNKLPTYDDDRIMIRSLESTSKILLIAVLFLIICYP